MIGTGVHGERGPELAHTGATGLGVALPLAGGALLAGSLLYRRSRGAGA
ncbi:hypothetical protein [Streptomyces sp. NPDC089919]